ncbi:MAG: DinB family protein, partial [Planctomycetaceae bacterium]|nr:DinB family protein [Planctomycetaceae bacterium]
QIVHHLADSHLQAYSRTKWAVTEEHPTIKPYDESAWSELTDARTADVAESLALLSGLHARWCRFLESLTTEQLARTFYHPESREDVPVWRAVQQYAWHARHHTAQIVWRRQQQGW